MQTQNPHILVVDDHRDIRTSLERYLRKNGMRATGAEDAKAARRMLKNHAVDLVVLDIMMPGEDGLSLCRELSATRMVPVILLTAKVEETDRIIGLEIGADDYVTKPFNPRELLARIKAVLRRVESLPPKKREGASKEGAGMIRFGEWTLDTRARALIDAADVAIALSTGEYLLLSAFVSHPGRVLTRDQLLDLTRGREAQPFDRAIDNQVSRLRRKIEADPKQPKIIVTHWGGGYRFTLDVEAA